MEHDHTDNTGINSVLGVLIFLFKVIGNMNIGDVLDHTFNILSIISVTMLILINLPKFLDLLINRRDFAKKIKTLIGKKKKKNGRL